ncbi:unnamed protein product, partial [Polarella glacialis]
SKLAVATLKMIDFGLSRRFVPGQPMKTLACTSHYVAPEVLEGQYTESCDLWSLGVSIYVLLCRSLPFAAEGEAEVLRKVRAGSYSQDTAAWAAASGQAKSLVSSLLERDVALRPTADEVLLHPWLSIACNN